MEDFIVCLNAVFPIFMVMALGYIARLTGIVKKEEVSRMSALAFNVFLPIMLFYNVCESDISSVVRPKYLLFLVVALAFIYTFAFLYVIFTEKETLKKGVKIQGVFRNNTAAVGLTVMQNIFGDEVGAYMVGVAVLVPLMNILAVITLELFNGRKPELKELLRRIVTNPLIIGSLLGLAFLLSGLKFPVFVEKGLKMTADVSTPLLLFSLGAFFSFRGMGKYLKDIIEINIIKMLIVPAFTLVAACLMGFRGLEYVGILSMFGSSSAVSSFAMTQQIGGDDHLAAYLVVTTSVFSLFTFFIFLYISKRSGLF